MTGRRDVNDAIRDGDDFGAALVAAAPVDVVALRASVEARKGRWPVVRSDATPFPTDDGPAVHVVTVDAAPTTLGELAIVPDFPADVGPLVLREFWAGAQTQTQTPRDAIALFTLAVLGSVIGGRVTVEPWFGWIEPAYLWVAVTMESGSRKSAVLGLALEPLQAAESEEAHRMAPLIREGRVRAKVADDRLRTAEGKAAKALPGADAEAATREVIAATEARALVEVPVAPRFYLDDCTPERLVGVIQEQGGRAFIASAEGGVFAGMGRYAQGGASNQDVYLKGHAGDPIRVDRIGRAPEQIDHPALSMMLAVQPDIIRGLADNPSFRGTGLLARFCYAIPAGTVGHRLSRPPAMSESVRRDYGTIVRQLLAVKIPAGSRMRLDHEAGEVFVAFVDALEPRLGPAGDLGHMADWGGKLAGAVARIAGILHMAEHAHDAEPWRIPVSVATIEQAITVGHYLTEHARAAFAMMGADPAITAAKHLLAWVGEKGGTSFVERDAFNATRGRFRTMDAFRLAVAVLVEHGYLRAAESAPVAGKAGRKASKRYDVNPLWVRR